MRSHTIAFLFLIGLLSACSGPSAEEHTAKGDAYLAKDMLPEATVEYRSAIQADPTRGDVRTKLGDIYVRTKEYRLALDQYVRAADLLPNDAEAQLRAGNLLLGSGQFQDARARAEKALALNARHAGAMILLGNALAGLKDHDGALTEYQEAIALRPDDPTPYANIGTIQLARGQAEQAEATLKQAVAAAPKSAQTHLGLGSLYWATRRPAEAEAAFKAALAAEPGSVAAHRALGMFYIATGRATAAEVHFRAMADLSKTVDSRLALADYYTATQRLSEAKSVLNEVVKLPDGFGPATLRLAAFAAAEKNPGVATRLVDSVLLKTPRYTPARLLQIRLAVTDERRDDAVTLAEALARDEPNTGAAASAFTTIGAIEAQRERPELAIQAFEDALKINSRAFDANLGLAGLFLARGLTDRASTYVQNAIAAQPGNPAARAMLVRVELARGNRAAAQKELSSLQKMYPNAAVVLNLVAAEHRAAGRLEAARSAYARVLASDFDDLEALRGLVSLELASGRRAEALGRVEDVLKKAAPNASLYVLAAQAFLATGAASRGEELLKRAIDTDPSRLAAYELLGRLFASQQRLNDARDQFNELVSRNPRSVGAHTMLGMILEMQKDLPAAEAQYQRTLAIDANAAIAANNLAWIYVSSDRNLEVAQQLASTALRTLPNQPQVNDTLGWIHYRRGQSAEAARYLEMAAKADPKEPTYQYHLGMAYLQLGDIDKGRKTLQGALAISTSFEGAAEAKKALEGAGREHPEA